MEKNISINKIIDLNSGKTVTFSLGNLRVCFDGYYKEWSASLQGVDTKYISNLFNESAHTIFEFCATDGSIYSGTIVIKNIGLGPYGSEVILLGSGPLKGFNF